MSGPSDARFGERAVRLAGIVGSILGWAPDVFWRATPAELEAVLLVLAGDGGAAPPDAATIAGLQGMYPDG